MHLRKSSLFVGRWALRCLAVTGHPFTARYLVVFVAGGKRDELRGQIWRDSQGRFRQELEAAGVPFELAALPDGSALQMFLTDPDGARVELVFKHPDDR